MVCAERAEPICDRSWHIMWHVTCDFFVPETSYGSLVSGTIEKSIIWQFFRELVHFSQKVYQPKKGGPL